MKVSLFSQKPFETESLAEVQFLTDGCGFVSQSNLLNNSSKDCDWRILAYFIREQSTADASFTPLKKNFGTEQSTVEASLFVKCEPMIENKRNTQKHEKTHNTLNFL